MSEETGMDEVVEYPTLMDYLDEQGQSGPLTLRDHLQILGSYADGLFENNAQITAETLEADDLDLVPIEIDQEDSPDCIVYYLPDNQLVRILPDYPFEIQMWEEAGNGEG